MDDLLVINVLADDPTTNQLVLGLRHKDVSGQGQQVAIGPLDRMTTLYHRRSAQVIQELRTLSRLASGMRSSELQFDGCLLRNAGAVTPPPDLLLEDGVQPGPDG